MAGRFRLLVAAAAFAAFVAPSTASAALSSSPASSWQTNGRVRAIAIGAHKIFIGGDFTMVRAPGTSGGGVRRSHLAALSLATGKLMPWNPGANGTVTALKVGTNGLTIYIGGGFTKVKGFNRAHLAAVSTSQTKVRKWHANTNGTVYAITASARRVFVGGSFDVVKGKNRHRLAALGTGSTAPLAAWHPNANSTVRALALSPTGKRVFAGGDFTAVNGKSHLHLAALLSGSGAISPFRPHPQYPVTALRTTGKALIVGGGGNGGHITRFSTVNGTRVWIAVTDGDVQGVAIFGGTVIVGGHFNNYCVGGTGAGNPLHCNTPTARRKALGLSLAAGHLTAWNPDCVGSLIGVSAVSTSAGSVQIGGAFTKVHGKNQQGFARFLS
jgi:hypothetical protein